MELRQRCPLIRGVTKRELESLESDLPELIEIEPHIQLREDLRRLCALIDRREAECRALRLKIEGASTAKKRKEFSFELRTELCHRGLLAAYLLQEVSVLLKAGAHIKRGEEVRLGLRKDWLLFLIDWRQPLTTPKTLRKGLIRVPAAAIPSNAINGIRGSRNAHRLASRVRP